MAVRHIESGWADLERAKQRKTEGLNGEELEETWESFRICLTQISLGSLTTPTMIQFQKKSIKPLCDL